VWITAPAWVLTHGATNSDIDELLAGTQFPGQNGLASTQFQDLVYSPYYIPKSLGVQQVGQLVSPVATIKNGQLTALTVLPTTG
jgi:hypothetical protein